MNRRDFVRHTAVGLGSLVAFEGNWAAAEGVKPRQLACRSLGRTGHKSSVVALGGILVMNEEQSLADQVVGEALDAGINHVDVAPTYGDAELKLGHALRGKRDRVFLACKTQKRDKEGAAEELRNSLGRLETDHFDLYQMHGLDKPEELEQALGPGGALEAFLEARDQGLIRFIGVTGHRPETLQQALRQFDFDTVMFPLNFILHHHGFGLELLSEANRRGVGVIAIKPIAHRHWQPDEPRRYKKTWYRPYSSSRDIGLAMAYVLSQPLTAAIPSGDIRLFRRAVTAARRRRELTPDDREAMTERAAAVEPLFSQ